MNNTTKVRSIENVIAQHIYEIQNQGQDFELRTDDIVEIVEKFKALYSFGSEEADYLVKALETRYVTTMGVGISLVDQDSVHDEEWYLKRDIDWSYWEDYENYLIGQGLPTRVVSSMNSVTDKILGLLNDPRDEEEWERRGLVIGHVQSGKTANYIGLITKAADAGYKFIIVIAGIHNNLRTQTQERIDEGFIGRDSKTKQIIGVGRRRPQRAMPVTVTTTESDFNKSIARRFGMQLTSLNNTFILVIKKNTSTLGSLYTWLKELNTRSEIEKITDIPMLLIDDEADNASINTNKPELDPTRINKEIRSILYLFRRRSYVGYTATPFANIFINPDSKDDMLGSDLFPEHFIHSLDAPSNYFGAEKIFQPEENDNDFLREIKDAERSIPLLHSKDDPVNELPPSLKKAIHVFLLCRAIRNLRDQERSHCSMLINMSRFVNTQREIKQLTDIYLDQLKKAIRFNYSLPSDKALDNHFLAELHRDFKDEYSNTGVSWNDVQAELNNAASVVRVFIVNSKSDEALDYRTYTKEGNALTAIVIGGLSLSRGLTIEGLTISYVYRNSIMYDTLMQMGRWFGYRDNYEDLCRIYMSEESRGWYTHIAEATEELRMQIKRMRRESKKPSDFGLYVRAHPDTLIVTALNKMRHTENKALQVSYDGKLLETYILPASEIKIERNRTLLKSFFVEVGDFGEFDKAEKASFLYRNVSWDHVQEVVLRFSFHDDMLDLKETVPRFIKEISDIYPLWDVVFQSLSGQKPQDDYVIAAQKRTIGKRSVSEPGWHVGNKQRFSGNSMFRIGLNDSQLQTAAETATAAGRKSPIYSDYTNARGKPVLMFHFLNLMDKENENYCVMELSPAISISFPNSSEFRTVDYVVNSVWLKQFEANRDALSDEEDIDVS